MEPRAARPSFDLGRGWWIAGGVMSLLAGAGSLGARPLDPSPEARIGELIGGAIAAFLIALLIAWIAWHLAGRSRRAGRIAFVVVLTLLLLSRAANTA